MNIFKFILLAIVSIIIFQFLGNNDNEYDGAITLPLNTKILAFGDSITYGYRVDKAHNYPSQLSVLLNAEVINAGISGEETRAGLQRLPALLEKYKPQILLLCEGGNDILRRRSMITTKENLAAMIRIAKAKKIHVILIGVPSIEIVRFRTDTIYYELASEFNIPLEDSALKDILSDDTLKIDNVHPNEAGYKILSNKIANLLTDTYIPNF